MLKQNVIVDIQPVLNPAAFGRLCVETYEGLSFAVEGIPAAFGRLCVETF